jgi:hypothetical protein
VYLGAIRLPLPLLEEVAVEGNDMLDSLLLKLAEDADEELMEEEEIRPSGGRDLFGSGNRTLLAAVVACWL